MGLKGQKSHLQNQATDVWESSSRPIKRKKKSSKVNDEFIFNKKWYYLVTDTIFTFRRDEYIIYI